MYKNKYKKAVHIKKPREKCWWNWPLVIFFRIDNLIWNDGRWQVQ